MKEIFSNIWATICSWYRIYSGFIHNIFPSQLGDLVEGVLDVVIVCLIIKLVADIAFKTKNNG